MSADHRQSCSPWPMLTILAVWATCAPSAQAQIADYPTLERVQFVEECIRDHPQRSRQEMIYKCSCTLDALAEEIPFTQFQELSAAAHAVTIAGERGNVARGDDAMKEVRRYRAALAKAQKSCLITP